ncbi:alpha/beta fold hydrolase [Prauserella shujinwangii]|nr:alpha/beta hydrolase [Prauserella shujinwangii]
MLPRLLRHPVWRGGRSRQGAGRGVLLVPGFGFGDRSLMVAHRWLRSRGYRPEGARIGLNIGCTTTLLERVERRLEDHAEATGGRVVVLGQSRGGWLGRLVAVRRPDLVRGLVMLASPVLDPLGAHPGTVRIARALTRLSAVGVPGLLDDDCFTGTCYRDNVRRLAAPLPADVPAVAVYSRNDAVVPWRLCRDPDAECVEVRSCHTAMGLDPDVYAALEPRLADWARPDGESPEESSG